MEDTVQFHARNAEGSFTVQTVRISEFYNRLRDQEAAANMLPRARDLGPQYGLLSECLSTSPVITTILSVSIRCDTDESYLVFVGERHIEVRTLTERLSIESLASKNDFYCKIRCAAALDIKKESSTSFLSQIKREDGTPFLLSSKPAPRIPKQVLVVALESGELGFIYLDVTPRGKLEFVFATHRISPEQPKVLHVGKSIAVDHHSRAMAVCAWEGCFKLYETHDATAMEQKVATGQSFIPLRHEKTFQVPGTILSLEFLRSSDPNHVVWLVLYVNRDTKVGHMRLLLYEWNTKEPLCKATQLGQDGLRLPEKWGLPTHVVPLTIATFFILICKQNIYIGKAADIVSGNCRWKNFPIPTVSRRDIKLVTGWARPHRNPGYAQRNDDFYIVKENGELFWIYINNSQSTWGPSIETVKSGKLHGGVGSAFSFHEVQTESSSDLLVAAGEACSGGTYLITPKQPNGPAVQEEPRFIQEIYNWTPMFDVGIIKTRSTNKNNLIESRARLYASAGIGEHGAVMEVRQGLEGRITEDYGYSEPITNLIALHGPTGNGCFVLLGHVLGTSLWYMNYEKMEPRDVAETISLRTGETTRTLAADVQDDGRCVQVTTTGVYSTVLNEAEVEALVQVPTPMQEWDCPLDHSIVGAALKDDVVILAMRTPSEYQLWNMALQPVTGGDQDGFLLQQGRSVSLPSQPTYLEFIEIGARVYLMVDSSGLTLDFYQLGDSGDLTLQSQVFTSVGAAVNGSTEVQSPNCESACIVRAEGKAYLLCGLRNGYVLYGELDTETLDFKLLGQAKIGRLPVLLSMKEGLSDRALAQTTHALHQLTIQDSVLVVTPVVFNQTIEPSIEAVCYLNHEFRASSFPDLILFATDTSLAVGMLSRQQSICTRQLALDETPSKLTYIEELDLIAVAVHRRKIHIPLKEEDRKVAPCTVLFIDPRSGIQQNKWDMADCKYGEQVFTKQSERINCLHNRPDWVFPDKDVHWNCLLVGTGYSVGPDQPPRGRILVLSFAYGMKDGKPIIEVRKRNQILIQEPVYCIASYGDGSVIFGAERSLYKMDLVQTNTGHWKFENLVGIPQFSTPTQITVEPGSDVIWVSSTRDALAAYRFKETPTPTFVRLYSDDRERAGRTHLKIEGNFFLTTDRDEGIVGLWMPNERRTSTNLTKVFDAYIPNSIANLRAGDLRAPWSPRNLSLPGVVRPDVDILGTCFDGSIYQLTVLDAPATKLLVYLQRRYLRLLNPHPEQRKGKAPMQRHGVDKIWAGGARHADGNILSESLSSIAEWLGGSVEGEDDDVLEELVRGVFRDRDGGIIKPGMTTVDVVKAYLKQLIGNVVL
ncbi:hypothetical protein TWF696_006963 [Orbilia brochopaga]|uniref:RSE1/DDB1/CPSF1 first beta-propeller domain-containing protein n=1 Tax=Orbilia brochopaga TaxID=3140254 RepID=A0AAV9URW8_9PEZI